MLDHLRELKRMFEPFVSDGCAIEPAVCGLIVALLDLCIESEVEDVVAASPGVVVPFRPRLVAHLSAGHVADRPGPNGGDAA